MDEIKNRINNLIIKQDLSLESWSLVITDIKEFSNEEEKQKLFDYLVKEKINAIKSEKPSVEESKKEINDIKDWMLVYGELTDAEIEDLFKKHGFTVEKNLESEETVEEKDSIAIESGKANLEDGVYQFTKNGKVGYVRKNGNEYVSLSDDPELKLSKEEYEELLQNAIHFKKGIVEDNSKTVDNELNNTVISNENVGTIVNEEQEENVEKREIEIIIERINELEQEVGRDITLEQIDEETKKLKIEKSQKLKEINDKIAELQTKVFIDSKSNNYDNDVQMQLEAKEKELDEYQREMYAKNKSNEEQYMDEKYNRLVDEIRALEAKINKTQNQVKTEVNNSEIKKEIERQLTEKEKELKEYQNEMYTKQMTNEEQWMDEKHNRLVDEIQALKAKIDELNKSQNQVKTEVDNLEVKKEIERQLTEKEKELKEYQNEMYTKQMTNEEQYMDEKYNRLVDEIQALKAKIDEFNKPKKDSKIEKEIEELTKKYKEVQSSYDKEIASLQNLKNKKLELETLKKIPPAYEKIKDDAISNFASQKLEDEALKNAIDDYINNRPEINELNTYPNADKLKKELKEEIFENLKVKKIDKKEQNKKMLYKGLAALAGFGTGLVLSSVPGVGTIRMTAAAAKLVASKINSHTKKHPEGKISTIIEGINNKINNSAFVEKHPKFAEKIINIKNQLKKLLESEKTQWFINGVAAGYLTGNIYEMITGAPIFSAQPKPTPTTPTPTPTPEPIKTPEPIPMKTTLPEIKSGAILDISGIKEGFVSSVSNSPVSLITEVGKNVEVDRIISANGIDMVHFKQLNGKGYAWFKLSDVQQYLEKVEAVANKWTGIQR